MYIPAHFAADDATVQELLARHGAADLITLTEDGLLATMLPFAYEPAAGEHGTLLGHVARNNDQWRKPARGESLAIVRGPDAYVSPSWYAAKAEHGRVVPTWNYVTAHVYGQLTVHDDPAWVEDVVRRLTAKHEAARLTSPGQPPAWSVDDAPRTFIEGQLRAIVGLELRITRIEAKAKLSQNRPVTDIPGVVAGLSARGDDRSAQAVEHANEAREAQDRPGGRRSRHPARSANLQTGYGGDDVRGDHLERGDLPDIGHRADRDLEAQLGHLAEPVDDLTRLLAVLPDVEDEVAGLGDLVVVAALGVAVRAQHVELARQVRAGEQVARVGVLGHEAQRLLLPAAPDHDRGVRPGQRLRRVQRPPQLIVLALVGALVAAPHLQADLQGFLQPLEPLGDRRERDAEPA
jgi:transcriptional regulator